MELVPLNPTVFDAKVEKAATRKGYGEGLAEMGERDHRIVALAADLTESTFTHLFAEKFPERFIQTGIAEQNLVTVAAGLAAMGKIPFAASYAMFSPGRSWEQIRTAICYNHMNVKLVGSHAGLTVGPDGGSHQALEDIAITRAIPRMMIICPCDAVEAKKATIAAAQYEGPVYIRLSRENMPIVTTENTPFELGRAQCFYAAEHPVVGIVSTGIMAHAALLAAKTLSEQGIPAKLINMPTIKPIDGEALLELAGEVKGIVTCEEHNVIGGLGGAVAEFLSANKPTKIAYVGTQDVFGQSGDGIELLAKYGLDADGIVAAAKKLVA